MEKIRKPQEIERSSFEVIRAEMGKHAFNEEELVIAVRVIHATADFDYKDLLKFHPQAISSGIEALRRGVTVLTDVQMVEAGISQTRLDRLGSQKICDIRHPEVLKAARKVNETRATMAMRRNAHLLEGGIAAIGNAPTALLEVVRMAEEEGLAPALIVGVPVGFINTVEAKEALMKLDVPYITSTGRKGGSSVAVAIINALMGLALKDS